MCPIKRGIQREEWTVCDRCGFIHPVSMLTNQQGLMLCKCHRCLDNLMIQERPTVIQTVLEDGEELLNVVGEQRSQDPEIPEF